MSSGAQMGFGIVGTGFIAAVVADAIAQSKKAKLTAVSSRKMETARSFTAKREGAAAVEGLDDLLARPDVDAIYAATPTATKEEIALKAIKAGKHVLIDKPFLDTSSLARIIKAARAKGVVFMDATHFVHHPRTAAIEAAIAEKVGAAKSLYTAFYFPSSDRSNIRFNVKQEPMGAVGDMAWYSMRAVVEYLRPEGKIVKAVTIPERDAETGAVVRASGLIAFEGGQVSTFEAGYSVGAVRMDLLLCGSKGTIGMDDFVLDWTSSFAYQNPDIEAGYFYRTGVTTRKQTALIPTPTETPQQVAMIENFVELASSEDTGQRAAYANASLKTQEYVDAIWAAMV